MQKKLIALAIAGLASTAAFAQSNVTVYGVVDASFESISATGATNATAATSGVGLPTRSRIVSNSSYIGFKGSEALGNGLNAVFQIENQLAIDNAQNGTAGATANTWANRDSYVGLSSGSLGTAKLGWISSPHRLIAATYDVMPGATGNAGFNGMIGRINTGVSITAAGLNLNTIAAANNLNAISRVQAIAYDSPSFLNGFSASLIYSPNENKPTDAIQTPATNPSLWNAALKYNNGPFKAAFSLLTQYDPATASATVSGSRMLSNLAAVGYTFAGATTVNLMYNQNEMQYDANNASAAATLIKNSVWWLGVKHVVGAHELAGMYAVANDGSVSNGTAGIENASERGAKQIGLRYAYNLSKRTQAYALYSRITNKANGNYDFGAGDAVGATQASATGNALNSGVDPQAFGVGLRHSF